MTPNKFFYGWLIVAVSALGICFGYVGVTVYAFSAFTLPLTDEFGWSRGAISLGMTFAHTTAIVVTPLLGILIDKLGVRHPLLISTFLFGAILCLFRYLDQNIWLFYFGMIALTALGSGTSSVSFVRLIVSWFDRRKGMALAFGISGAGVGALILPPFVTGIIAQAGWRNAYLVLGAINLLIVLPILFFAVRNTPAEVGSHPDGDQPTHAGTQARNEIQQQGLSFGASIRTGTFWKLAVATLLLGMALNGAISQLIPLLIDRGVARQNAGNIASILGLSIIISRFCAGYLLDRFHAPFVAAAFLICPMIGFASLAMTPGEMVAAFTILAIGIGLGLEFDALGYFCAHYFGRVALGRIYGTLFVIFSVGGALGSSLGGFSYDHYKSYVPLLIFGAVATFIAVLFTASLGRSSGAAYRSDVARTV